MPLLSRLSPDPLQPLRFYLTSLEILFGLSLGNFLGDLGLFFLILKDSLFRDLLVEFLLESRVNTVLFEKSKPLLIDKGLGVGLIV